MKLQKVFPITALVLVVLMWSCNKDRNYQNLDGSSGKSSEQKSSAFPHDSNQVSKSSDKALTVVLQTVNLGVAGNFVILSKSGITDVYKSSITGDIGTSPITGAALLVSCAEVAGNIYTVDAAGPLPCRVTSATMLTTAIGNMQTAYTDAAGRSNPNFMNLGAGNIGGRTLRQGLYKFTSSVVMSIYSK